MHTESIDKKGEVMVQHKVTGTSFFGIIVSVHTMSFVLLHVTQQVKEGRLREKGETSSTRLDVGDKGEVIRDKSQV